MINIRKFLQGIGLIPVSSSTIDTKGEMEVLSSDGRIYFHDGSAIQKIAGIATTDTLTNKIISGSSNTLSNIATSSLTGTLPVANGGTGVTSSTGSGNTVLSTSPVLVTPALGTPSALVLTNATGLPTSSLTGQTSVANGGTGLSSLTAHTLLIGNGTSGVTLSSVGATNTVLHGNTGADPTFSAIVNADITNGTIDLTTKVTGALPIANGGTGQATKAAAFDALQPMSASGDIIYGGASGTGTRLPKGSDTQVLTLVSGLPAWAASGGGGTGPRSQVVVTNGNGFGSTNTMVRRWTTIKINTGSAITYADSATLGGSFTINTTGLYTITMNDGSTSVPVFGIVINGTAGSTLINTPITYAQGLRTLTVWASGAYGSTSWTGLLTAGDVIWEQTNGNPNFSDTTVQTTITQINT